MSDDPDRDPAGLSVPRDQSATKPGRRRRVPGGRQARHVVRVTPEEEAQLLRLALEQNVSIPRLLVESALSPAGETPSQRREAIVELFAIHRLLANVANNMNQIARGVNTDGQVPDNATAVYDAVRRTAERIDAAVDRL